MALIEANRERLVEVQTGSLYLRVADTAEEVMAAQALRYRVFYEGMAAKPTPEMAAARRDFDSFDEYCDHLLVFDSQRGNEPEAVVGTYRLMRREAAARRGKFYSSDEYDIGTLLAFPGEILELGRSCIDERYRTGATMQILWRGIAEYVLAYNIELMFGCASLPGVNPEKLALPLAYLYHHHLAPPALRPWALPHRYVAMNRIPPEAVSPQRALQMLPPLIKGYLRLGAFVGEGAVVDYDFGTTDVCVVVKTEWVTERYHRHYTRDEPGTN
ncbi:MAG: GNAT family N-acetyltransferase [Kiloniellaceae bacterium]